MFSDDELDRIILQYKDMVYRIAWTHMKNAADADDVFQEVFIRLVRHVSELKNEEHIKAWLIRVTINCCNSLHGESSRKRNVPYDDALKKTEGSADSENAAEPVGELLTEDAYGVEQDKESVLNAVMQLSASMRDVVYLFYYEDYSIRMIANTLGVNEGSVKTRLSRARAVLRDRLKDVVSL